MTGITWKIRNEAMVALGRTNLNKVLNTIALGNLLDIKTISVRSRNNLYGHCYGWEMVGREAIRGGSSLWKFNEDLI